MRRFTPRDGKKFQNDYFLLEISFVQLMEKFWVIFWRKQDTYINKKFKLRIFI
jgi:hypothetical protein